MEKVYITKENLEKLKKELEELKTKKRKQIAEKIKEIIELGDLTESSEYTQAKEEQAFIEGRILELEDLIKKACVIEEGRREKGVVEIGSKIKVKDRWKERTFIIVGPQEAVPEEGKISYLSPFGRAFLGKKKGDEVEIKTPKGLVKFKILKVY